MAKAKVTADSRKIEIKKKSIGRHSKTKASFAKQSKNYEKKYRGQGR
jgi:hypothetical protein